MSCIRSTGAALLPLALSACAVFAPTIEERQRKSERPLGELEVVDPYFAAPHPPGADPSESAGADRGPASYQRLDVPMPRIAGDQPVQLELRQTSLAQAIHLVAERAGVNIYLDASLDRAIDVSFRDVALDDALQVLLERNGLRLSEGPRGIFWVQRDDGSEARVAHFRVQNIPVAPLVEVLTPLLDAGAQVVVDPAQNLVVVKGTRRDADIVADFLEHADHLQRQVLIEVRIVEVKLDENFEFGVTHAFSDLGLGNSVSSFATDLPAPTQAFEFVFDADGGDVMATIQALNRYVGTDLLSSPRLLAVTNTTASIEVIEEVPYINVTSTQTGNPSGIGTQVLQEVEFKEVGVKLSVTPTIEEGGTLHIAIEQELSEVVSFFESIPVVDKRSLKSQFLVADRQTIVLGGLMQDRLRQIDSGVPGLMSLPYLGRLFRSDEDEVETRELIVFLTPRIVSPSEAASMTGAFREGYRETLRATGVAPTGKNIPRGPGKGAGREAR